MAKKCLDSELQFRCDYAKKQKAKYLCKAKLGMTLSKYLQEAIQGIVSTNRDNLSKKQRLEMQRLI